MAAALDDVPLRPLAVRRAERIAEDIHCFEVADPGGADLPPFTAGAHLVVRTPAGPLRRYSLCNDPAERDRYVFAVRRESGGGGGSVSLVDGVEAGATLPIGGPRNDFALKGNPASYLFIAGGIGITPILSMIRHLRSAGGKPFKLYYLTRSREATAFREELSAPEFRGKVVIHHDLGDPDQAFDLWPLFEQPRGAHLYCCGPRGLMQAVRDMTGHWSSAAVHFEDFGTGAAARAADDAAFNVRLARSGEAFEVPPGTSLLEALRARGHAVPSSCESGTCGTCRVGLVSGEADHRDLVLSDHERATTIMACVSRAVSPDLVLDL